MRAATPEELRKRVDGWRDDAVIVRNDDELALLSGR
jgi:hypothetical protein